MKPVVRCSGLDRLISCPGSRTLDTKLAEDLLDFSGEPEGDAMTWRGNWCHWESARRLILDFGAIAPDGLLPPVLPKDWQPQAWDERAAAWYVENVVVSTPPDHAIFVEHRLNSEFPGFILSGQLDVYTVDPEFTEFTIDDQKSGPNEVDEAGNNWQLAGYAALLKLKFPSLLRGKARIFQRAATNPISEVEISELDDLPPFMNGKITAALADRLTVQNGYKQCRLCPCIEFCPALDAEIIDMKITLTEEKLAALKVAKSTKELAELAARGRAIAGPIERLLAELKERLVAQNAQLALEDGTVVAIVEEEGRRKVTNPRLAHEFIKEKVGEDAAWECLQTSLTELEDQLVATGMKKTSKKEESATSWIKERLSHLITRPKIHKLKFT